MVDKSAPTHKTPGPIARMSVGDEPMASGNKLYSYNKEKQYRD
jgi:hypothetical protein